MFAVQKLRRYTSTSRLAMATSLCSSFAISQNASRTGPTTQTLARSHTTSVLGMSNPVKFGTVKQGWMTFGLLGRMASTTQELNPKATDTMADLTCDHTFKRAFSNPDTVRAFLTAFFDAAGDSLDIDKVSICPTKDCTDAYNIFDAHCVLVDGSKVIVKVRRAAPEPEFRRDALGASYAEYAAQKEAQGVIITPLVPVKVLVLMKHDLEGVPEKYRKFVLTAGPEDASHTGNRATRITFVQLPLAPPIGQCTCEAERWAVLLRDAHSYTRDTLPEVFQFEPFCPVVEQALKPIPAELRAKLDSLLAVKMNKEAELTALRTKQFAVAEEIQKKDEFAKSLRAEIYRLRDEGLKEGADVAKVMRELDKLMEQIPPREDGMSESERLEKEFDALGKEFRLRGEELRELKIELMMVDLELGKV